MNAFLFNDFILFSYLTVGVLLMGTSIFFLSFYFLLSAVNPRRRGYLLFGWTTFFLALFAYFAFRRFDAGNLEESYFWARLQIAAMIPQLSFFFQFSAFHLGFENKFYRRVLPIVNLLFLPTCLVKGWMIQHHFHEVSFSFFGQEAHFAGVGFGPAGYVFVVWSFANAFFIGLNWIRKFLKSFKDFGLLIAFLLFLGTAINDFLVSIKILSTPPLFAFGFSGFLIVMAYQLFKEYLEINRQLETKTRELESMNEEMRFLVWSVSHDLAGPLLTIHGFADLIRDSGREDPQVLAKYLDRIKTNVDHMKALINDLGTYLKAGRVEREMEEMDLRIVAQQALILLNLPELYPKAHVEIPKEWPKCQGCPKHLKQIFFNLVQNSLNYAGTEEVLVKLNARKENNGLVISVEDNGPGIPEGEREKIFEPFYRKNSDIPGTGMGLAIVKKIVETHGGRVWVDPAFASGTRILIRVPPPSENKESASCQKGGR